jgi:hypothetical protein
MRRAGRNRCSGWNTPAALAIDWGKSLNYFEFSCPRNCGERCYIDG